MVEVLRKSRVFLRAFFFCRFGEINVCNGYRVVDAAGIREI